MARPKGSNNTITPLVGFEQLYRLERVTRLARKVARLVAEEDVGIAWEAMLAAMRTQNPPTVAEPGTVASE